MICECTGKKKLMKVTPISCDGVFEQAKFNCLHCNKEIIAVNASSENEILCPACQEEQPEPPLIMKDPSGVGSMTCCKCGEEFEISWETTLNVISTKFY